MYVKHIGQLQTKCNEGWKVFFKINGLLLDGHQQYYFDSTDE